MEYISKDKLETAFIKSSQQGSTQVVEITYVNKLEEIEMEYKMSKDRARRKELKEQYRVAALELNSQFKKAIYNETL
jgi:ribonuclease I